LAGLEQQSQNMNPISPTARGWLLFTPVGPKTKPGVESMACTQERSPRKKNRSYWKVGVRVNDVPALPGPKIKLTAWSWALPVLVMYSQRPTKREAVFEGVIYQERATVSRSALNDAYFRVGWHSAVLIVWLDNPGSFCIRVYDGVHAAVVLHRCTQGLKLCLPQVSHRSECQTVRPVGIGQRAA